MGNIWRTVAGILCLASCAVPGLNASLPHRLAPHTVVLANADDPSSVEIARAYQAARGLPEANVILLPVSGKLVIDRSTFVETIWNPLRETLLDRDLLLGKRTDERDLLGRRTLDLEAAGIRYLAVCRGVPVKIAEEAELDDSALFGAEGEGAAEPLRLNQIPVQLRKNQAAVDSELALLMYERTPLTGVLTNPLFRQMPTAPDAQVVRVTRLDGPSPEAVLRLIRNTIEAETIGLRGRAYFDLAARSGSYRMGDEWIARAAELAEAADFDVTIDHDGPLMAIDARFDLPAIYFGWYSGSMAGVFKLPALDFPSGAIAAHLHSASASDLRNPGKGWVGPLVEMGVTATVGNVYEPYLEHTHHFDLLLQGLLQGMNFGDAAYAALPSLSWQAVAIGDPLYEPAWVGLAEQVHLLGEVKNAASDPYVRVRQMNRLLREGETEAARMAGVRGLYATPGPALALKVAELEAAEGDLRNARRRLGFAALTQAIDPQDWALFHAIARRLVEWEQPAVAVDVYANLLADSRLPRNSRLTMLEEAVAAAHEADMPKAAVAWRQEWHELKGAP